jgi:hypothetical protein
VVEVDVVVVGDEEEILLLIVIARGEDELAVRTKHK